MNRMKHLRTIHFSVGCEKAVKFLVDTILRRSSRENCVEVIILAIRQTKDVFKIFH